MRGELVDHEWRRVHGTGVHILVIVGEFLIAGTRRNIIGVLIQDRENRSGVGGRKGEQKDCQIFFGSGFFPVKLLERIGAG